MLASVMLDAYYAHNYASIIGAGLFLTIEQFTQHIAIWLFGRNIKIQCGVDLYADNTINPAVGLCLLAMLLILLSRNSFLKLFSIKVTLT